MTDPKLAPKTTLEALRPLIGDYLDKGLSSEEE